MYIQSIKIEDARVLKHLEIRFPKGRQAGWHVIIGDNGAGKSTFARLTTLGLLAGNEVTFFVHDLSALLTIDFSFDADDIGAEEETATRILSYHKNFYEEKKTDWLDKALKTTKHGFFSATYGPFRRLAGGKNEKEKFFESRPKLGAHLSIFGEDVALSGVMPFLKDLYFQKLEEKDRNPTQQEKTFFIDTIVHFINSSNLLPHETQIHDVMRENIFFQDGNGQIIDFLDMSDGYRSVLSLIFDLLRQLVIFYGEEKVIRSYTDNAFHLSGIVIIDEIDAHLHPSWQAKIGEWFVKYFPKLQFIVTTHSPIICRACGENGTIWHLPTPGTDKQIREIVGTEKYKMLYGNILDAYGTGDFGQGTQISAEAKRLRAKKIELQNKAYQTELSPEEEEELNELRTKIPI